MALSVKTREHIRRWAALAGPSGGHWLGGAAALAAAIAFTGRRCTLPPSPIPTEIPCAF